MDNFCIGAELVRLADDAVIKSRADVEEEIALDHRFVGVGGAMHTEHAEAQCMSLREDAFTKESRSDRALKLLCKLHKFLISTGDHRSLTSENHGALRCGDESYSFFDTCRINVKRLGGIVARKVKLWIHVSGEVSGGNILRNINEHRPRSTGGGDVVGFLGNPHEIVCLFNEVVVLHDGNRDSKNIGFLEGVLTKHPCNLLPANNDHRNGVHLGGHQSGDCISCSRAGSDKHGSGLTSGAGVAIGHVDSALFVTHQDKLHLVVNGLQGVKNGDGSTAGVSEHVFDAEIIESFDEGLCSVKLLLTHK